MIESEEFWDRQAQSIPWISPYKAVWEQPKGEEDAFVGRWFVGGQLNGASICVDRWVAEYGDRLALTWVGEEQQTRTFTYQELSLAINRAANLLRSCGVKKGDRVGLWMPMVPELPITQLACAKLGAVSVVVFSGFSAANTEQRLIDAECRVLVTADGGCRGGKKFPLRSALSQEFVQGNSLTTIITCRNASIPYLFTKKDVSWDERIGQMSEECCPEPMDSEDPLFLLYTSGTSGKPKGILHTTAGYLLYSFTTMRHVWGIQGLLSCPSEADREVWFCTADIGWITGHSYLTYAPFALGCKVVMYEGVLTYPSPDRLYSLIDQHRVSHFYTSPTLLRQLASYGDALTSKFSLDSLKVLGSVGESILPETWHWYHEKVGKGRCPIVDTYWQTETGGYIISPLAGKTDLRPGSCTFPFSSIQPKILREDGTEAALGEKGALCVSHPWPGIMRTVHGDHERFLKGYLQKYPGYYDTGDEAYRDHEGYFWILGRSDDVIKVAGHRIGTAELEATIATFPGVVESAVIAVPDAIKGNALVPFVVGKVALSSDELSAHIRSQYGPIASPARVIFVSDLPKTRSGKIMRRLLRSLYLGEEAGDISTLINPEVVDEISSAGKAKGL